MMSDLQEQVLSWLLTGLFGWCVYIYFTAPIRREFYENLKETLADEKVTEQEQTSLLHQLHKALRLMTRTKVAFLVLLLIIFRGTVFVKMARAYNLDSIADWVQQFWPQFIFYTVLYLILFIEAVRVSLVGKGKKENE
jgi:hypothetical protein